jgi:hypothetical protein
MALGVVDADVGHPIHEHALQREQRMVGRPEAQRHAEPPAQRDHREARQCESQRDADVGRRVADLVGDGMPGRAPGEHADGEQVPAAEAAHSKR